MAEMRHAVLEQLAAASDAERRETTTIDALAVTLDVDERPVEAHLQTLASCDLARFDGEGRVRVTCTGEEFLELDIDGMAILDTSASGGTR